MKLRFNGKKLMIRKQKTPLNNLKKAKFSH